MQQILVSILLLAWPSALLHVLAFGRKSDYRSIRTSLIGGQVILAGVLGILSIIGLFSIAWIVGITAILVSGLALLLRKKKKGTFRFTKKDAIIILIALIYLLTLQQVSSPYSPDGIGQYIPWARDMAEEGGIIPATQSEDVGYMYTPPLSFSYYGYAFLFTGADLDAPVGISIFFSITTVFLIWSATRESRIRYAAPLAMLMLLSSFFFVKLGKMVLTEPAIIFFATAALLNLQKYWKRGDRTSMTLMLASSASYGLIKFTGLLFTALMVVAIILRERRKEYPKALSVAFLTHIPLIALLARNTALYNNPVFPWFASVFPGAYNEAFAATRTIGNLPEVSLLSFTLMTLAGFPAIILAARNLIRTRQEAFSKMVILTYLVSLAAVTASQWPRVLPRYQMQFYGFFAILAGVEAARLIRKTRLSGQTIKRSLTVIVILALIAPPTAFVLAQEGVVHSQYLSDHYGQQEQQKAKRVADIIQSRDPSAIVTGHHPELLEWYGLNHTGSISEEVDFIVQDTRIAEQNSPEPAETLAEEASRKSFIKISIVDGIIIWGEE